MFSDVGETTRGPGRANEIRRLILQVASTCSGPVHLGGSLSAVEILDSLYGGVLQMPTQKPTDKLRDIFILSKGHTFLAQLAALCVYGLITEQDLFSFQKGGHGFISHPVRDLSYGIESSTGSLGHGLSYGLGVAQAMKYEGENNRHVYVLLGDSECSEGSVWEAAILAPQLKLGNVTAIVDSNGFGNDRSGAVQNADQLVRMFEGAGWVSEAVDGHDRSEISSLLTQAKTNAEIPSAIIARTIKGKGVSFMENNNDWHHAPVSKKVLQQALGEL